MIIKKIKLNNIRSYTNQEIEFPEGSTLLSGNIGSGKSTIFLALDFVLFGVTRELPGSALLRNGEDEGSVELTAIINNKEFSIKRNLKRSPTSVAQTTGHIIIDEEKTELTAMELKQKVLELLSYPQELLTKSKSMIYHYTVYSPQEKMKEILLGKKEDRLEILRKVFGIDKYKRVRDNSEIFITAIKQKSKEIAAKVADLEQKSEELSERKQRYEELKTISAEIIPKLEKSQIQVNEKKGAIEILESRLKELEQIKHEKEKTKISLEHKEKELETTKKRFSELNPELMRLEEELKEFPPSDPSLKDRIQILETEIKKHEEQNIFSERKKAELETQRKNHEKLSNDINSLDHCPICKQEVDEDHKHKITSEETSKIQKLVLELDAIKRNLEQNQETLSSKKEELKKHQTNLNSQDLIQLKQKNLESKKSELTTITAKLEEQKLEITHLKNKNSELENKEVDNQLEQQLSSQKNELELLSANLKDIEIKKASSDTELKTIEDVLQRLDLEVKSKEKARSNISKLMQLKEWIEKQFISMTQLMEKNIMLRVHAELESLIQKWFSMLADSETIKIKIDEEFTPIIEQNGYETEYTHLSGGEKTAAALSYRLALNQVINTLMSTINTKNILMLDEPTDGFSQEQLERMRNILEELNTKQTIIVSHDPKVESFVDNVIRLEKSEHITSINI